MRAKRKTRARMRVFQPPLSVRGNELPTYQLEVNRPFSVRTDERIPMLKTCIKQEAILHKVIRTPGL
jgi:hypothetical protein